MVVVVVVVVAWTMLLGIERRLGMAAALMKGPAGIGSG